MSALPGTTGRPGRTIRSGWSRSSPGGCRTGRSKALDAGAGTGIGTRALAGVLGSRASILAVEPSPAMRREAEAAPGIRWLRRQGGGAACAGPKHRPRLLGPGVALVRPAGLLAGMRAGAETGRRRSPSSTTTGTTGGTPSPAAMKTCSSATAPATGAITANSTSGASWTRSAGRLARMRKARPGRGPCARTPSWRCPARPRGRRPRADAAGAEVFDREVEALMDRHAKAGGSVEVLYRCVLTLAAKRG